MNPLREQYLNGETLIHLEDCTLVASHTNPSIWYVLSHVEGWSCQCPSWVYRGSCRHSAVVRESFLSPRVVIDPNELTDDGPAPARLSPAKRVRLAQVAGGAPRPAPLPAYGARSHGTDDGEYMSFAEWRERKAEGRHE